MIIRKFIKEDLSQVLELCREVRQHHIDILDGYFTEQNDEFEQLGFLQSIENDNTIAFHSNAYSKIGRAKWFLDDDTPTGEAIRKVYVYLTH